MKPKAKAKANTDCGVVVFGKDEAGKPHASAFSSADAELAMRAASLMGMQVLRPVSEAAREVAAKLPKGRVFASGRGFVPFVRPKLYEALTAAYAESQNQVTPGDRADAAASGGDPTIEGPNRAEPATTADLQEGNVVLAPFAPQEGWWEAVVVKTKGDLLTLRWRDFPDEPQFARRRKQLALFEFASAAGAK